MGLIGFKKIWNLSHPKFTGKIMGASHERGHLLRSKTFSHPDQTEHKKIVIVGGGISGLSAAWKLNKSGVDDFALLELEDEVGGNSASGSNSVSAYPWGAHYIPLPGQEARAVNELFEELKVIEGYDLKGLPKFNELYVCAAPDERLFILGQWQEGLVPQIGIQPEDKKQYQNFFQTMGRFKIARGKDRKKAFAIPLAFSSQDPEFTSLDRISMEKFMDQNGWNSVPLRWYVNYCCRDDYGCEMKDVSAWAGIHYFASRTGKTQDGDDHEVLAWPEGNGWIVQQLKKKFSSQIRPKSLAYKISQSGSKTHVDYYDFQNDRTHRIECDHVIYCAPKFTASYIVENFKKEMATGLSYAPWMVANLTLNQLPAGEGASLSWDNVIYQSFSLGYIDAKHQSLSQYKSSTVITHYTPLSSQDPGIERKLALARSYEDWSSMVLKDLKYAHPHIESMIKELNVWIWGHAMARPTPDLVWNQRLKWPKQLGNIHFAHSDMSGLSIFEEAQYHGVFAVESILKSMNHKFATSL